MVQAANSNVGKARSAAESPQAVLVPLTPTAHMENSALVGGQQVVPVHIAQGNATQNELN